MALILSGILTSCLPAPNHVEALQASDVIRIFGQVNRPLNLSLADLLSFPMVSEVAELKCVIGIPDVTYNWTGIPLFYLLTLAQIKPEAYKVVTRARSYDGFSSDLLIDEALKPTTILALGANGTDLPEINGIKGLYRLVVPGNYGYKWVAEVDEIEVVDYAHDYNGTYESSGFPDDASRPDVTVLPLMTPPLQDMNFVFGNLTFTVSVFTNVSIDGFALDYLKKQIDLNITVPSGTEGFADLILPQNFLKAPYSAYVNTQPAEVIEADLANKSYLYVPFPEGSDSAAIAGSGIFGNNPLIVVSYNSTVNVGETAVFDAKQSSDYGLIISYVWSFGDGSNGTGAVVSHVYNGTGTYDVNLVVTDNQLLSSSTTLTVRVQNPPEGIPLLVKIFFLAIIVSLITMFALLVRSRKTKKETRLPPSNSG
jgi:hypothetical protein